MIFNRLKLAVDRVIAAFSVIVMIALVVCVVWQVFSRLTKDQLLLRGQLIPCFG